MLLSANPFEMPMRKRTNVNFNYRVAFDGVWLALFTYARREVEIFAMVRTVAVLPLVLLLVLADWVRGALKICAQAELPCASD